MTAAICTCGHAEGDHRVVANGLRTTIGVCLAPGCSCQAFMDATPDPPDVWRAEMDRAS